MNEDPQERMHFLDYWRIIRARQEIVIAGFLFVVITGIVITYARPKYYQASAKIEVREDSLDMVLFPGMDNQRSDPLFIRTQFEKIQSEPVVEEVVRRLKLDDVLGKAYGYSDSYGVDAFEMTVKKIRRHMKVQHYRDTRLIEVQVMIDEPKESAPQMAASICNMIVEVYADQCAKRVADETGRQLSSMQDQIAEHRKKVDELKARLDKAVKGGDIIAYGNKNSGNSLDIQKIVTLEETRLKVKMELEAVKAKINTVKNQDPNELVDVLPVLVQDSGLQMLINERRKSEVELMSLLTKEGLGPSHPDVTKLKGRIAELNAQIDKSLAGLTTALEASVTEKEATFAFIEDELLRARGTETGSATGGRYREFDDITEELAKAKHLLQQVELHYEDEKFVQRVPKTIVENVAPAKVPDRKDPESPNYPVSIILSILFGLGIGVSMAYFIEYLDTSVKTLEEVERLLKVPVMGVIPQKTRAFIEEGGKQTGHQEAYRVLRTNLQFAKKTKNIKTICVTSGSMGEGKSLTVFNLAYTCAQMGDRVLVIDSDLHRPRQHKIFGVSNTIGLINVLLGEVAFEDAVMKTPLENLTFLPSGKHAEGVHGVMGLPQMHELMMQVKDLYDFVFFDAPPIIGVSDASMLVGDADGVLQVIQHRKYPRAMSLRAKNMIQSMGANLLGVVLNNINVSRDYSYYYQYYYTPQQGGSSRKSG